MKMVENSSSKARTKMQQRKGGRVKEIERKKCRQVERGEKGGKRERER